MKKILAIILSIMLVFSMGIMAFAEGDTVEYTDQGTVVVKKLYKLEGAGSSPAETFTLHQVGNGVVKDGEATEAPALGTIAGAVYAAGAASTTGAEGTIEITLPAYDKVGVYVYTLAETAGTTAGVTYYDKEIKLVVTVINDETTGRLRVAAVHTEEADENGNFVKTKEDGKKDTFENIYSAGSLSVSKTVTGNLGDKTKFFEFTVTLTGEEGKTYATDGYAVTGGSGTGEYANPATIKVGDATTFYLKDGDTISIANLPYGVEYTVEEKDYSAEGYETYIGDVDDSKERKTSEGLKIKAAEQSVGFTNNKGETVDTGVFLDSLPYMLIIAIVAIGGAMMMFKRRRVEA